MSVNYICFSDYTVRGELLDQFNEYIQEKYPEDETMKRFIQEIQEIEE